MRDFVISVITAGYFVVGLAFLAMGLALIFLWMRYWIFKLFPKFHARVIKRRKDKFFEQIWRD